MIPSANLLRSALVAATIVPVSAALAQDDDPRPTKFRDQLTFQTDELDRSGLHASYADVLDKVRPAVVSVFTTKKVGVDERLAPLLRDPLFRRFFGPQLPDELPEEFEQGGLGSGVVVTPDGYILTNNHVIAGADEIKVKFAGNLRRYDAEMVGADPASDIAVIKIEAEGLEAATLTDSTKVRVGDVALAIGTPLDYEQTVTHGIVSATGRHNVGVLARIGGFEDFIQTDASINPGNSGGALIDTQGRVIGINTAIASGTGGNIGIGFAVPISMAVNVAEALVQDGEVSRGFLGVELDQLDENLARAFGIDDLGGALVNQVVPGSPAEKAGFEMGDIIVGYEGRPVTDARRLRLWIGVTKPEVEVDFEVFREGEKRQITVKLAKRSEDMLANLEGGGAPEPEKVPSFLPGVEIANLGPELREEHSIGDGVEGVLVTDIDSGSAAAEAGLSVDDIVVAVNRQPVVNVREAAEAAQNAKGDVILLRVLSDGRGRYVAVEREEEEG